MTLCYIVIPALISCGIRGHNTYFSLLTYSLTPWSRVLLEKLTVSHLVKNSHILWNPKCYYSTHMCQPHVLILSQFDPFHTPTSHFRFPHQNPTYASLPPFSLPTLILKRGLRSSAMLFGVNC